MKIVFPNEEARKIFATWLCDGGGEQDYFRSMEASSSPSLRISYHPEDERFPISDKRRYGPFLGDNTIRVMVVED